MSLLDSVEGRLLGLIGQNVDSAEGEPTHQPALVAAVLSHLSTEGMSHFLNGLSAKGLGDVVKFWIGKGENLPISAEGIESAFGSDKIASIAKQVGLDPAEVSARLSTLLPSLVDRLTPHGQVEPGGDMIHQALDFVKHKLSAGSSHEEPEPT